MSKNVFSNLDTDADESKIETDFIGGGGAIPTDIYPIKFSAVYPGESSSSNARSINFVGTINGKDYRETIWVTNGKGETTYKDKNTGKKKYLPGWSKVSAAFMALIGTEIGEAETVEKTLKIWDSKAEAEVPTSVDVFEDFIGLEAQVAVQRQIVDKQSKGDDGKYHNTGDTRVQNEIIKFFPAERLLTISEIQKGITDLDGDFEDLLEKGKLVRAITKLPDEPGEYATKWLEKNKGEDYDKSTGAKSGGSSKGAGKEFQKSESKVKANDLFGDDD